MRGFRLLLIALLLAPAVGCAKFREMGWIDRPKSGGPIDPVTADRLVKHLNDHAAELRSVEYDAAARVSAKGLPAVNLHGDLTAAQPRSFRMAAKGSLVPVKFDLGSNSQQFWVYVDMPREEPYYRYASHQDFEAGRAPLPGGIPFDPDWVMQALGMMTFPPDLPYVQVPYSPRPAVPPRPKDGNVGLPPPPADPAALLTVPIDIRERTYTLRWQATTPNGTPGGRRVIKEVVFAADLDIGTKPRVQKHLIRDEKTNKVLASADVQGVGVAADPAGGRPVTYPTRVVLKWTEQEFEMDLDLRQAKVNQLGPDATANALFVRPDNLYRQTNPINLANYQMSNPRASR